MSDSRKYRTVWFSDWSHGISYVFQLSHQYAGELRACVSHSDLHSVFMYLRKVYVILFFTSRPYVVFSMGSNFAWPVLELINRENTLSTKWWNFRNSIVDSTAKNIQITHGDSHFTQLQCLRFLCTSKNTTLCDEYEISSCHSINTLNIGEIAAITTTQRSAQSIVSSIWTANSRSCSEQCFGYAVKWTDSPVCSSNRWYLWGI